MSEDFKEKCLSIKEKFLPLTKEEKYNMLIQMGKNLASFPDEYKIEKNIVQGCQSILYLSASHLDGKLYFNAHADALISAGLAAILISAFSGETAETILTSPPTFLTEIGIPDSLSPNRSNGLAHIHLRMKQEALKALTQRQKVQSIS